MSQVGKGCQKAKRGGGGEGEEETTDSNIQMKLLYAFDMRLDLLINVEQN